MIWKFDQAPDVACITCRAVIDGKPILVVTHYEDDHSWSFMDGSPTNTAAALVVAMSEVVERHPELQDLAFLPPGWSAMRVSTNGPWITRQDDWSDKA